MSRVFRSTCKFDRAFMALDTNIKTQATRAMSLYIDNSSHPSLHFKKVKGTKDFFEIRVNLSVRIILNVVREDGNDVSYFMMIGSHDEVF